MVDGHQWLAHRLLDEQGLVSVLSFVVCSQQVGNDKDDNDDDNERQVFRVRTKRLLLVGLSRTVVYGGATCKPVF